MESANMFEIVSSILKYVFTVIIYIFIYNVIRLILIDIRSVSEKNKIRFAGQSFLKLIKVQGKKDFQVSDVYLLQPNTTLGRSKENVISLDDSFLSASHAVFTEKKKHYYIKDNGSTNGTFVNGKRIGKKSVKLKNGDKITLGRSEFEFVHDQRPGDQG